MPDNTNMQRAKLMTDQETIDRLIEFQGQVEDQLEVAVDSGTLGHFSNRYAQALLGELADLLRACHPPHDHAYRWYVSRAAFEWAEQANSTLTNAIKSSYSSMDRQVDEMAHAAAQRTISLVLFDIYQDLRYRRDRIKETI